MPVLYADIIVDISAGNLDRVFQYRIPSHLNGIADIGSQVMIPFGKSNRMIRGFIVNMTSRPDYDESKIKDIDQVINNELAMESQLIRLAWQIRKVYGGTMNQALKTVIPVKRQVKAQVNRYYSLTQDEGMLDAYEKRLGSDRRYKTRMELIRRLKTEGTFSREELLNVCHVSPSVVKALVSDGILVENVTRQYRRPMGQLMDTGQPVVLSPAQSQVVREICEDEQHRIHLIHGITGSGKTEIYMELIAEVVARGRQAIFRLGANDAQLGNLLSCFLGDGKVDPELAPLLQSIGFYLQGGFQMQAGTAPSVFFHNTDVFVQQGSGTGSQGLQASFSIGGPCLHQVGEEPAIKMDLALYVNPIHSTRSPQLSELFIPEILHRRTHQPESVLVGVREFILFHHQNQIKFHFKPAAESLGDLAAKPAVNQLPGSVEVTVKFGSCDVFRKRERKSRKIMIHEGTILSENK